MRTGTPFVVYCLSNSLSQGLELVFHILHAGNFTRHPPVVHRSPVGSSSADPWRAAASARKPAAPSGSRGLDREDADSGEDGEDLEQSRHWTEKLPFLCDHSGSNKTLFVAKAHCVQEHIGLLATHNHRLVNTNTFALTSLKLVDVLPQTAPAFVTVQRT